MEMEIKIAFLMGYGYGFLRFKMRILHRQKLICF